MSSRAGISVLKKAGLLAAVALLLAGCGERAAAPASPYHATDISSVADFQGKVVMMFFGFTNCPDVCPTTMADMAQVVRKLGGLGERVQGILVTVDPARNTPTRWRPTLPCC